VGFFLPNIGGGRLNGIEGLAFVPDGSHPYGTTASGGVFYAGWQYDGDIYAFEPDFSTSGVQTFLGEIHMTGGYTDLSALAYNPRTGLTYALYDGLDLLEERDASGTLVASYSVPGSSQEGLAVLDDYPTATATMYVAEDGGDILAYGGYPVTYSAALSLASVDADGDGIMADVDSDDSIPNAGVESAGDARDNDGDGVVDERNTLAENGPHPYFSTLAPTRYSGYGSEILSASGLRNGDILVEFADRSLFAYHVHPVAATTLTRVTSLDNSGYFVATVGNLTAVVDGYDGTVLVRTGGFRRESAALAWARMVVGWR
jgi:hypothetical protein